MTSRDYADRLACLAGDAYKRLTADGFDPGEAIALVTTAASFGAYAAMNDPESAQTLVDLGTALEEAFPPEKPNNARRGR